MDISDSTSHCKSIDVGICFHALVSSCASFSSVQQVYSIPELLIICHSLWSYASLLTSAYFAICVYVTKLC